jgi:hypothetical protein
MRILIGVMAGQKPGHETFRVVIRRSSFGEALPTISRQPEQN